MTRDERIATAIESLEAIRDGKTLQQKSHGVWVDLSSEDWLRNAEAIRIKPEPILRPWTEAEIEAECVKGTVIKTTVPRHRIIGPISVRGTEVFVGLATTGTFSGKSAENLLRDYVIAATGAPCGVYETPTV